MDTSGLKDLLASYDHHTALKRTLEEKKMAEHTIKGPTSQYVHLRIKYCKFFFPPSGKEIPTVVLLTKLHVLVT